MVLLDQQRVDQLAQQPAGARVDAAHDAEVEEDDLAVVIDIEVARVQVAVEQPMAQPALEDTEQQCFDQFGAVEAALADLGDIVDTHAGDSFHRQDALAGQIPVHLRHPDVAAQRGGMHVGHPRVHRLGLEAKVQFFGEVVGEVGHHVLCGEPPPHLGQLHELRTALEDLEIGGHSATDAGPLDLDHDLFTGVQGRVVRLRDRRRGERLLVERLEQVGRVVTEFFLEQPVYGLGIGGRHPVQQTAELAAQRFAEGPWARRDDLSELDIGGAEIGERLRDLLDDLLL